MKYLSHFIYICGLIFGIALPVSAIDISLCSQDAKSVESNSSLNKGKTYTRIGKTQMGTQRVIRKKAPANTACKPATVNTASPTAPKSPDTENTKEHTTPTIKTIIVNQTPGSNQVIINEIRANEVKKSTP